MTSRARTARDQPRRRGWFIAHEPDLRIRGLWLLLAFAAMGAILSVRLVDVQLRQGPHLAAMAAQEHSAEATIHAQRGRILDRSGRLLASGVPVYDVFADPGVIPPEDRHAVAEQLAPVLNLGTSRLEQLLNSPGRFVYLAHRVSEDTRSRLAALRIYGVDTIALEQRVYDPSPDPGVSFAANLIGFVDHDGHGQYGIEGYYDKVLRGTDGVSSTLRDLSGNPIVLSHGDNKPAVNGSDLRLGLDSSVQYWAEQAIAKQVTDTKSASGTLMMIDTHTGSIRAWADYPSYDANHFAGADIGSFRDTAIADLYEPGSVMKVVTFAGGLDHHAITPTATLNEQQQVIDGFLIHDWDNRSHGTVTFQWVLDDSLNNGAIEVMRRLGKDSYYRNLLGFGIGSPTGIDLAGEQNQPLRPQAQWSDVDYATASFGQQVQVTPVEMLAAVNAVANNGVWVQPHAVDAVVDPSTGTETAITPATRAVISPDAAATLKKMMTGVVEDRGASGYLARMPAFKGMIGGKTGTASVAVGGRYTSDTIDSFVGFMPADNPQFTMMVILRKPQKCSPACEGAYLAAPVWKQVATLTVDAWKIVPQ